MLKRVLCMGVVVCMVWSWSGCSGATEAAGSDWASMENPFVDCDSVEDGEMLAGFSMNAPKALDGYGKRIVRVIKNELLEFQYEDDKENALIRKGKGLEDISGDYNVYEDIYKVKIFDEEVTFKGNDGYVDLALWKFGEYSYSVSIPDLTEEEMIKVVKEVY